MTAWVDSNLQLVQIDDITGQVVHAKLCESGEVIIRKSNIHRFATPMDNIVSYSTVSKDEYLAMGYLNFWKHYETQH